MPGIVLEFYRPKFRLHNLSICGWETLARWNHPLHGLLCPASFMLSIKREGLFDELLAPLLDQGLRLQQEALERGLTFEIAVILDASQLATRSFVDRIKDQLRQHR